MRRPPVRCSILLGLALLGLGCAAKSTASMPPSMVEDMGYDVAQASAEAMGAPAEVAMVQPTVQTPARSDSAVPAAGVLAAPAPRSKAAAQEHEPAVADDDLPTRGADAVDQMLVFNGAMSLLVDPDGIPGGIDAAVDLAVRAGGYVSQQTDTSLVLRVPSRSFRRLMKGLEGLGDVRSRSVQTIDVSEEFHDLDVRLKNLQATRTRIQKLLGQAKDLGQILTVEKELERVSAEIDRIEGRLRFLSSQAAFSTVTLSFGERPREVKIVADDALSPPPPPPPARLLDTPVDWLDEVDVHHMMSLH